MLYPLGLSHSNRKMDPAAAWTATITTNIQEEKSCGHAKCTRCSDIKAGMEKYKGRADAIGQDMYEKYRAEKICHDREHLGERDCE